MHTPSTAIPVYARTCTNQVPQGQDSLSALPFVPSPVWAALSTNPSRKEEPGGAGPQAAQVSMQIILETTVQPGDPLE